MPTVYLETTIPSYLAAFPSRDLVVAAHQQITHEWWRRARERFVLYTSEAVMDEIRSGDSVAVARRQELVEGLPILRLNQDVNVLVDAYDGRLGLTGRARADLVHIAFAVAYELDYLLTWNCRHIANGEVIRRLVDVNNEMRRKTPLVLTPQELLEP